MTETTEDILRSVHAVLGDWEVSRKVVNQILQDLGGCQVYLPLPKASLRDDTRSEIYRKFNGANRRELCREYNIAENTFYTIIREERERRRRGKPILRQGKLL